MPISKRHIILLILILKGFYCHATEVQYLKVKICQASLLTGGSNEFEKICKQYHVEFKTCHSFPEKNSEINKWLIAEIGHADIATRIGKDLYSNKLIECAELNGNNFLGAIRKPNARKSNKNLSFKAGNRKVIKVAVVDDGFRLTHDAIKSFIYTNEKEIKGNKIDDDGNGYVDDIHGWDVSDHDNNVYPPLSRLKDFYHGTHIASIITSFNSLTDSAIQSKPQCRIEILPVKCLSDEASGTYLKDCYKGVEYAIKAGADIINCSWGGGTFSQYEQDLMDEAQKRGILIVASAGNFYSELSQFPASYPSVVSVAALSRDNIKLPVSNYGSTVDLADIGENELAASVYGDDKDTVISGTSVSVARVSGKAAFLLACYPYLRNQELLMYLQMHATPLEGINKTYAGKLGAGKADVIQAIQRICSKEEKKLFSNAKGYINGRYNKKNSGFYEIKPEGKYKGIVVKRVSSHIYNKSCEIIISDTSNRYTKKFNVNDFPDSVFIPASAVRLEYPTAKENKELVLYYSVVTVDSSKLYCTSERILNFPSGIFSDGSGDQNYCGGQDCKWLISVKEGSRIRIAFPEFNTEAHTDKVYIFDGDGTQARIIGIFSGLLVPPEVASSGNKMLVWFVTDNINHFAGWKAKYETVEP
ncbi:S8 family serine peptidase [Sporocytophaga myxococcoides]|uniref:S8 family serine peptidase n=1 Tax=Sporocytophaga myxococcoides TaxID=153721 RepID=UPI00041AE43E|nr:S8 family serine peptidase [Sporocytophaga myxococcoides]